MVTESVHFCDSQFCCKPKITYAKLSKQERTGDGERGEFARLSQLMEIFGGTIHL